jgi:Flp pilus assembly protein TadG
VAPAERTEKTMHEASSPATGIRRRGPVLRTVHLDQRGMITAMIVRIAVIFAVGALVVSESGQVIAAQIKAEDAARVAAVAAADDYARSKSTQHAAGASVRAVQAYNPSTKVISVSIARDGTATVTVVEEAHTLIVKRLSFLKRLGEQQATETQGRSP